jgi:hypothetical protein
MNFNNLLSIHRKVLRRAPTCMLNGFAIVYGKILIIVRDLLPSIKIIDKKIMTLHHNNIMMYSVNNLFKVSTLGLKDKSALRLIGTQ